MHPLPSFHSWLSTQRILLSKLTPKDIEQFLSDFSKRPVKQETKTNSERLLLRYLDWLYNEGNIPFDPDCLKPDHHKNIQLDDTAERFLQYLRTTRKQGTVSGYRSTLRAFHLWLKSNNLTLKDIARTHMTQWLIELMDAGQSAVSRATKVICIRIYFSWLNEEGLLNTNALHLVRTSDIPKRPEYLPRPLPPKIDEFLQERLASNDSIFLQGLLLMRKTGIRIGELCALPNQCILSDCNDNHFLKVPLGKLNNERLVPLDDDTLFLVKKLQQINAGPLKHWLIEDHRNRKTAYDHYRKALLKVCEGLDTDGKITTHRLRHTYATSLLNGGMSLVSLMKLLGHRSYRMTLRYAAVTQETIGKEYRQALKQLENKYDNTLPIRSQHRPSDNPLKMLSDVNRRLKSIAPKKTKAPHEVDLLIKRINRLILDISKLNLS
jgi:site-specific recombinase XerD